MTPTFHQDLYAGRIVLVTGGTSGIGAGIADAFADLGAAVTVTGATAAEADAARSQPGFRLRDAIALDVRDDAAVRELVANLPRLDVLVNCAGTIRRGVEHDPAEFEQTVAINLTGTARCCAHARPKLAAGRGAIVNIASMYSFFGAPHAPGYASSKGRVVQLTKSLPCAYPAEGIRVNAVAPGWIQTPLTQPVWSDPARSAPILARTPLAEWPEEFFAVQDNVRRSDILLAHGLEPGYAIRAALQRGARGWSGFPTNPAGRTFLTG